MNQQQDVNKIIQIYFSTKQQQIQVKKIMTLLKAPMDDNLIEVCNSIVKRNNYELYQKYCKKKPHNIDAKTYLQKLNHKSTLTSALMFLNYLKTQNNQIQSINNSAAFASITNIGDSILDNKTIMNKPPDYSTRYMPEMTQKEDIDNMDDKIKQREREDAQIGLYHNREQPPTNRDPSQFLLNDPDLERKKKLQQAGFKQPQQTDQDLKQMQPQQNGDLDNMFSGFLATDIFNSNNGVSFNVYNDQPFNPDSVNINNRPQSITELENLRKAEISIIPQDQQMNMNQKQQMNYNPQMNMNQNQQMNYNPQINQTTNQQNFQYRPNQY